MAGRRCPRSKAPLASLASEAWDDRWLGPCAFQHGGRPGAAPDRRAVGPGASRPWGAPHPRGSTPQGAALPCLEFDDPEAN